MCGHLQLQCAAKCSQRIRLPVNNTFVCLNFDLQNQRVGSFFPLHHCDATQVKNTGQGSTFYLRAATCL